MTFHKLYNWVIDKEEGVIQLVFNTFCNKANGLLGKKNAVLTVVIDVITYEFYIVESDQKYWAKTLRQMVFKSTCDNYRG